MKLLELNQCYKDGGWSGSRELIGSLFPEKFTIEKNVFRTARVNEVLELIYMINNALLGNKKGIKKDIPSLSRQVASSEQMSNFFMKDLESLLNIPLNDNPILKETFHY